MEAVVGASIQNLLENLLTISQEQISLVRHFKNDLETLRKSLSMVQDFLHDAEMRQVTDDAVKRWLRELEALAFDADNVFDDIDYQLLSNKVGKTVKKKVLSILSSSNNPIAYRLKLGRRIKDIIEKLKSINQQASDFGLQTRFANAQAPASGSNASGSTETDSFTVDTIFIGRENDVEGIVGMMITAPSPAAEQVLSVLPIVGMGGLGKTTLARKVWNDEEMKTPFETRVWVHVPRNFDVLVLLKNILTSLTTENVEHGINREALLKKLQTHLGAKKYLLVLDDVWNEDREKWDDFVKSFSGISSATGNCMIVTTRSQEVASIVKTLHVHTLKSLSDGDCWSIIEAKTFSRSREFETIGRNIAKRCQGLPLAAKVVGGLLCDKSKDEWLEIEKKWLSDFGDGNPVSKVLKLSFDNLSSPLLKKCFSYCSIFPKGYVIEKENLIELWMAEGFLQTDRRSNINMETGGNNFFNILLHNSLLQVARRDDYGNVRQCNMHDLVHDLACSMLRENDNVTDGVCQSRYIGCKPSGDGMLSIPKGQERFVRTLFFDGEISDIDFSDFESLRSLTLRGRDSELPTSIRELKHLRYLDISKTGIRYLPNSIGELYHMQTLRAKEKFGRGVSFLLPSRERREWVTQTCCKKFPNSLSNLISLRHFHISRHIALPPEIGKLTSLQTLPYFHVGSDKGCGISELGNLKDLKGKLEIFNLERVRGKYEAMSGNLFRKTNIHKLSFTWLSPREVDEANDDESVLEGLQPHPNLKSLEIFGFKGKSFPQWTSKMAIQLDGCCWEGLDSLMEIRLEKCSEVEELPMLGHLPHLKSLCLDSLENVRSIGPAFYNIKDCSKSRTSNDGVFERDTVVVVFGALERLELKDMPNLTEWAEVGLLPPSEGDHTQQHEVRVFPRLECLRVERCMKLVGAPSHFPCLKELWIEDMESRLPVGSICGTKLTSLTFNGIEGLECLPDGLLVNNHNLLDMRIEGCPNMTCLVPCLRGGGASLKKLCVNGCPKLRELTSDLHSLNALEELVIDGCPELKSIPYPYPPPSSGQWQGFTSLRELKIHNCEGLECLPYGLFSNNHNLSSLEIHDCPKLRELPSDLHTLISLKVLDIRGCPSLKLIRYPPPRSKGGQQGFNSLGKLMIHNCERLTNMPIEMVESWSLSLESLELVGLCMLTNIPMVIGCVHRMPNIRELIIRQVPKFSVKLMDNANAGSLSTNSSLQVLDMGPFPDSSWDNVSFNKTVDVMLLQFISLRRLSLRGMEHCECLPDELQHLNALEKLSLYDYEIEALPEWFGNLSSLVSLELFRFKKLRHLPSVQAMLRLSKLNYLWVYDCPLLLKEKRSNSEASQIVNSEWPKISHIPRLFVDHTPKLRT